jgi:hypothetical protein
MIKITPNTTNKMVLTLPEAVSKVENDSVDSCLCPICRGFTPVAYINNDFGSFYELPKDFSESIYSDVIFTEVLDMGLDIDTETRQIILEEIIEEDGVVGLIFACMDALSDSLGIEWAAQNLSDDGDEFNILCQLECDYDIPDEYIASTFINACMGKELTLQQKRYHTYTLGEGYALPLVDNFIEGLCEELEVYVDTQFEDIL